MVGEISGINADTYTVNFISIGNCTWSTDTREPRSQTWEINRAIIDEIPSQGEMLTYNGEPQLSKNSVSLENIAMSDTVIVNRLGDGVIFATSNNSNVATAINVDSEVTIWWLRSAQISNTSKDNCECV